MPQPCHINAKVGVAAVQVTRTFSFMRRARCGAATKSRPFKKRVTHRSYSASSGRVSVVHGTESARVSPTASRLEQFDAHRAENRWPKKRSMTEVFGRGDHRRPPTAVHRAATTRRDRRRLVAPRLVVGGRRGGRVIVAQVHTRPIILSNELRSCARVVDRWHR